MPQGWRARGIREIHGDSPHAGISPGLLSCECRSLAGWGGVGEREGAGLFRGTVSWAGEQWTVKAGHCPSRPSAPSGELLVAAGRVTLFSSSRSLRSHFGACELQVPVEMTQDCSRPCLGPEVAVAGRHPCQRPSCCTESGHAQAGGMGGGGRWINGHMPSPHAVQSSLLALTGAALLLGPSGHRLCARLAGTLPQRLCASPPPHSARFL